MLKSGTTTGNYNQKIYEDGIDDEKVFSFSNGIIQNMNALVCTLQNNIDLDQK